jgi:adenine-specific DNA methylase
MLNKYIQKEIKEKRKERLLAVILLGSEGKEYNLPSEPDINALTKAQILFNEQAAVLKNDGLLPAGHPDPGEIASARYLPTWEDHFNARQLLLVTTLIKNIRCALQLIQKDPGYTAAIAAALYHIVGKHINYNCRTTRWHTGYEKIGDVMSFRRPSLTWDHTEVNPFVKSSGTLLSAKKGVINGLKYAVDNLSHAQPVTVYNKSVLSLQYKKEFDIIVTDPPYCDNVQYGELSDFFYVWARQILKKYEPGFDFPETPKSEEIDVSPSRHGSREASMSFYEAALRKAFKRLRKALKDHGLLVLFFAHKNVDSWALLANTLQRAGFTITSTWPIHTENANNVIAKGNSIMSSIVITARKRFEDKTGYAEEIKEEMEAHVKKRVHEFKDSGMRDADVMVAAMGSALEIITQYSDIKSLSGNSSIGDILCSVY